ncbi:HAD-IA family hydrolase [Kribbella sp. CA-293567]|uniref:HAD-IA family hydrolase n=1 Tax=Kribbella sp. CA-293567 TaxID=3002436 RepID=UPI0022DE0750|nr:HAD-IA family hydrolase [Kribbella sp. CA-293567]WBQ07640.1 HAD-IA family hydrolase [Kribbella sp. CA-293567]
MPLETIDTVLFDADGVIQRGTVDWQRILGSYVPVGSADDFVLDLMVSEKPSIVGQGDFREAVAEVLQRWSATGTLEDVLQLWREFEADQVVIGWIQQLRAAGIGCHLATNQQAFRRAIMHDERRYGDWFDQTFYSCDFGLAKPDPAYFKAILAAVDRPGSSVLFIDDNAANIEGARQAGVHAELYDLVQGREVLRELLARYGLTVTG